MELLSPTNQLDCANKFGSKYAARLRKRHQGYGDTFFIDEVFIKIDGKQRYLWRAVDQDGEVVDVFLQDRRDAKAAKRFFRRMLKKHKGEPRKIVTDKTKKLWCSAPGPYPGIDP